MVGAPNHGFDNLLPVLRRRLFDAPNLFCDLLREFLNQRNDLARLSGFRWDQALHIVAY